METETETETELPEIEFVYKFPVHCVRCSREIVKHLKKQAGVQEAETENDFCGVRVVGKVDPEVVGYKLRRTLHKRKVKVRLKMIRGTRPRPRNVEDMAPGSSNDECPAYHIWPLKGTFPFCSIL